MFKWKHTLRCIFKVEGTSLSFIHVFIHSINIYWAHNDVAGNWRSPREQAEVNPRLAMEAFYIFCLITDKEDRWAVCLMFLCWNRKSTAAHNGGWQNKNMWPVGVKTGESEAGQA